MLKSSSTIPITGEVRVNWASLACCYQGHQSLIMGETKGHNLWGFSFLLSEDGFFLHKNAFLMQTSFVSSI